MRAFTPGRTLGTSDLAIQVLDSTGDLVSPFFINYSIVGISEGTLISVLANQMPACSSLGCYYASFTIPINWKGNYQIGWHVQPVLPLSLTFHQTSSPLKISLCLEFNSHENPLGFPNIRNGCDYCYCCSTTSKSQCSSFRSKSQVRSRKL